MSRWLVPLAAALLAAAPRPAPAQAAARPDTGLAAAAERLRAALERQDVETLIGPGGRLVVQLPGAEPTAPLARSQAMAVLRRHLAGAVEEAATVRAVRPVGPGAGYVELARRYRLGGAGAAREEAVLVSLRRGVSGWEVAEVRLVP